MNLEKLPRPSEKEIKEPSVLSDEYLPNKQQKERRDYQAKEAIDFERELSQGTPEYQQTAKGTPIETSKGREAIIAKINGESITDKNSKLDTVTQAQDTQAQLNLKKSREIFREDTLHLLDEVFATIKKNPGMTKLSSKEQEILDTILSRDFDDLFLLASVHALLPNNKLANFKRDLEDKSMKIERNLIRNQNKPKIDKVIHPHSIN